MSTPHASDQVQGWPPVDPRLVPQIVELVGEALTAAYKAQRAAEIVSGVESRAAANNIIDAFAHLSKLFSRAGELSFDEQSSEVHSIGDHLKRAILEGPEEVLTWILSDITELWNQYVAQAIPLVALGEIDDADMPTVEWMAERRGEWSKLMTATRERKNGPDLAEAILGADEFSEMIQEALVIRDRLRSGIAMAELRSARLGLDRGAPAD